MRITLTRMFLLAFGALALNAVTAAEPDQAELTAEAKGLVKSFAGRLKPQLKQALAENGPVEAIAICADVAPTLASELAAESGWTIRRVSLKARNATDAAPDDWERGILQTFDERAAQGAKPPELNTAAIRDGQFRYMQAQGVEGLCLLCHGQNISEPVQSALQKHYPQDAATDYVLGQVRGAISLSRAVEP